MRLLGSRFEEGSVSQPALPRGAEARGSAGAILDLELVAIAIFNFGARGAAAAISGAGLGRQVLDITPVDP